MSIQQQDGRGIISNDTGGSMVADLLNLGVDDDDGADGSPAATGGGAAAATSKATAEDDEDEDGPSLRRVASNACKRIDIGTAVMPKPLFRPDIGVDYDGGDGNSGSEGDDGEDDDDDRFLTAAESPTTYARVVEKEFNAIVVEHHLKWAPLCVEPFVAEQQQHHQPSSSDSLAAAAGGSSPLVTKDSFIFRAGGGGAGGGSLLARQTSAPPSSSQQQDRQLLGRYDFQQANSIVDWALERDMKVKGHVLVWAVTSPSCLKSMEPDDVRTALKRHIFTTMAHFRGRISCWDVVNEPLAPDGSMADNVFLQKLGPDYVEEAFRWAHEADPSATLLLNENKVEGLGTQKGDKFYNLMVDLTEKGVPVHGVGLQAHFNAAGTGRHRPPTPRMVKQQIRRLGELGLSVNMSEMDVRVSQLPATIQQVAQRQIYHDIVAAALSEPAFDGIWLWGFTDRHTWVTHFYYDDEPLIYDESYRRKEAYYGLRDAIRTLVPGGLVGGDASLLTSDVDSDGNHWGYQWMRPEPDYSQEDQNQQAGDARPDWEVEPGAAVVGDEEEDDDAGKDRGDGNGGGGDDEPPVVDSDEDDSVDEEGNGGGGGAGGADLLHSAGSPHNDLPPIS